MAIQQGGFKRKSKVASEIPDSSLADVAFLLLIFFMVSTVFPQDKARHVTMPEAGATDKVDEKRQNILHLWFENDGNVFINDQLVPMTSIAAMVAPMYEQTERRLVVAVRADRDVPYAVVNAVTEQLRNANVLRVNFATDLEQRATRARR
jgi:biopolymer transport protein ExbD